MTHRFAPLASLLVVILVLSGCVTPSERNAAIREDDSFAMHILRGADIRGLRDAPRSAATSFGGLETGVVGASDIGRIGHVALSAANPVGGMSALGAGVGAGLLSFLMVPGEDDAERSGIMAWAPAEFAQTSDEAEVRMLGLLKDAFQRSIVGTEFEDYEFVEGEVVDRFSSDGAMTRSFKYVNQNGRCGQMRWGRCDLIITSGLRSHAELAVEPDILGGKPAWRFTRNRGLIPIWSLAEDDKFPYSYRAMGNDLGLYTRVSEQLPDWVFIYIAPNRVGFYDQDGALKLYPLPVVLNQGRAHYFVKGARGGADLRTTF